MKDKYRKYLLVFVIFVVVVIFVDIIFNFSGILMNNYKETFDSGAAEDYASQSETDLGAISQYERISEKPIRSIISKMYGKVINIYPVPPVDQIPTQRFMIKINGQALSVNKDGTYGLVLSNNEDVRQHWELNLIRNTGDFITALNGSSNGYNVNKVSYPFYICRSVHDITSGNGVIRALQYEGGYISVRPIGNYDNQKWDISNSQLESNVKIHNTLLQPNSLNDSEFSYGNYYSKDEIHRENNEQEKLNINLKLNQEIIDQLFGNRIGSNNVPENGNNEGNSCSVDNWLPRDSVRSACKGCDPDLIQPPV
jgi:hypothetical protein